MNTHRAYLGADTALTVWIRDESGKVAFATDDEIALTLYPYSSGLAIEPSIDGAFNGGADVIPGRAVFTITNDYAEANLSPGPYRYVVLRNGAVADSGLLEVV